MTTLQARTSVRDAVYCYTAVGECTAALPNPFNDILPTILDPQDILPKYTPQFRTSSHHTPSPTHTPPPPHIPFLRRTNLPPSSNNLPLHRLPLQHHPPEAQPKSKRRQPLRQAQRHTLGQLREDVQELVQWRGERGGVHAGRVCHVEGEDDVSVGDVGGGGEEG